MHQDLLSKKDNAPKEIDFDNLGKPIDINILISTDIAGFTRVICSNASLQAKANNKEEIGNLRESIEFNESSVFLGLELNSSLDEIDTIPLLAGSIIFFIVTILLLACLLKMYS